jgi:hypothetical protein
MPDYQSANPDYCLARLLQLQATMAQADQHKRELEIALEQARKVCTEIGHQYHDGVVGARGQVIVQYGPDAAAVALIGRTRKSERRRPSRRQTRAE